MTGRKKKKSLSPDERRVLEARLAKLTRLQAIYNRRGHDKTPVDAEIDEISATLTTGGLVESSEDKK